MKKGRKACLGVLAGLALAVLAVFVHHRVRLALEAEWLTPLGELVEVDGAWMCVYTEGMGPRTLVFLAGGGTCAPVLDFRSLYARLPDSCRIAVVEKFGYGFSDDTTRPRDVAALVSEDRDALAAAGLSPPYVLCPHSMSGLEALYWAQTYPEEVAAIVGLDMAVPGYYDEMRISLSAMRLGRALIDLGIARLIPGLAGGDASAHGTLTEDEQAVYRALFYRRTASAPMLAEARAVRENARTVAAGGVPAVPMLLFLSNGTGTGFETARWREIPRAYLSGAAFRELDCPHYLHDYEYDRISREILEFLEELGL